LPEGTRVPIAFDTDLGPGLDFEGDRVRGTVLTKLVDVEGDEVVPYGAVWEGRIAASDLAARTITVRFERVQTPRGWAPFVGRVVSASPWALPVRPREESRSDVTVLLGRTPGAVGGGPPSAPQDDERASLGAHGNEVVIPAHQPVDLVLTRPVRLP
jgi:hypothetical protein